MSAAIAPLAEAIASLENGLLLVVTGAGVSAASGIATFRGTESDAIWKVSDVELATRAFFERDPVEQWRWYLHRFAALESAEPNAGHEALAALEHWQVERGGRFQLVTQNIDTLHEAAGTEQLIKIHGTSARLRCTATGCRNSGPKGSIDRTKVNLTDFESNPCFETLPRCPICAGLLRAHVLFFDEYYQDHEDYRFEEAIGLAGRGDLLLFVGTSFSVGITDLFLGSAAERGIPAFSIDPSNTPPPQFRGHHIRQPAEKALPNLVTSLASLEASVV